MKIFSICILMFVFTINLHAAKPGGCSNVPISVTFVAPNAGPAAIWNDDPTKPYSGGPNTQIHNCDGGSYDGTMSLTGSRKIKLKIPIPITGSIVAGGPPYFAGGNSFATGTFMNIHNLTGQGVVPANMSTTYYSRVTFAFNGPDRDAYRLHFYPDYSACPGDYPCAPDLHGPGYGPVGNQPVQTAWVKVTHISRDRSLPWSTSNTDSWIVDGDLIVAPDTEVARSTLFCQGGIGGGHCGQYSMPFKMVVTALAAIP